MSGRCCWCGGKYAKAKEREQAIWQRDNGRREISEERKKKSENVIAFEKFHKNTESSVREVEKRMHALLNTESKREKTATVVEM